MTKYLIILALIIGAAAGYLAGYRTPGTHEKVVTRDVIKVVRETFKPDGTREKETRTENKTSKETKVVVKQPQWGVQLEHGTHPQDWRLGVSRRIYGDFSVTASTNLRDDLIFGLRYEF